LYFNPRSQCRERPDDYEIEVTLEPFQSTLSIQRATIYCTGSTVFDAISIHAPRQGNDIENKKYLRFREISIHTPYVGSDAVERPDVGLQIILIHTPNERSDCDAFAGMAFPT
jgi:hypothetical protein